MKYGFLEIFILAGIFLLGLTVLITGITLGFFLIKALIQYINSKEVKKERSGIQKSLDEVLKEHRENSKMTQEFVAEKIDVSRQAVSKWENGKSAPSTANLIALAKLFQVSVEEILEEVE